MKKIVKDMIYNILSTFIVVIIIQFYIYPYLAKTISISEYGYFLLFIGLINMISVGFSSALGNLRLITQKNYLPSNQYNSLLIIILILVSFMYFLSQFFFDKTSTLYLILTICMIFKNYHAYSFRLQINYNRTLILNVITSLGYLLGVLIFNNLFQNWTIIFITGELLGILFLIFTAQTVREKFEITKNSSMYSQFFSLSIATLLSNSMIYMDRLILFPLLGSQSVSVFVVASFVGKSIGLVITPINSVFLTYISKSKKIDLKLFKKIVIFLILIFTLVFLITCVLGDTITKIMYPEIYNNAAKYINISSASALTFILGTILNTFMMKMNDVSWQLKVQITYVFAYVILGITVLKYFDLQVFIYFTIILNLMRVYLICYVINKYSYRQENNK